MNARRRLPTPATSRAMQRILAVLKTGDYTPGDISERAFVAITTLTKGGWLREMQRQGLIHVTDWRAPARSGNWTPVWRHGGGWSRPAPPAAGNTEYARRWRHKHGNAVRQVRREIANKLVPSRFSLAGQLGARP